MVVEIGSEIRIRDASKELYDWAQENLIIPNPQYRERERRGLWVGNTRSISGSIMWMVQT